MNRVYGLLFILLMLSSIVSAQSWTSKSESKLNLSGIQDFLPIKSVVAKVSDIDIKNILWSAPYEYQSRAIDSPARLRMMMADGTSLIFGIVRYDMQEPLLAAKFNNIRTFKGICLSDKKIRARLDYTVHGMRAVINAPNQHIYIEHYKRGNKDYKIIYDRKDYISHEVFTCGVTEQKIDYSRDPQQADVRQGTCEFNTLRLANATTAEYSDFHISDASIPDEEEVHSAVVTTINRVNEVYEQDFGVRMVLIDNNEEIYYYDSATDPYTNGSGGAMLSENQENLDDVIGNDNYDIGHVFSTGGGGVAYLSSVCNDNNKAGGVTGQNSPIGDPFDIDYVAHEMGHQMGANHTQNNPCNSVSATRMEPGSASTIMGYAGICAPNVQSNSDPYFHAISVEEVMNDASVFSCAEEIIDFGNTSPEVTLDATTYDIPKSTTFILKANGSDPDGDEITYCWEQMDNQSATMPPASTNTGGPAFRTFEPVSDSKRYFPSLPDIIAGNNPTWEVLPSVSRDMNFRVTVRDWHIGPDQTDGTEIAGGCTAEADVVISVDGNSGPFIVNSQATNVTWNATENETIEWDVAGTDNTPISCSNVEIWFSEDDTFDAPTLVLTTDNDGSADIIVPNIITTTGRIMVKGEDNIFFDINEGEITIEETIPTFTLVIDPPNQSFCNDVNGSQSSVNSTSVLGYATPITLSILSGLPSGTTATFSTNPIDPGDFAILQLNGFAGEVGDYDIIVQGQSGAITKSEIYQLSLSPPAISPVAISPIDGADGVSLEPTLQWENLTGTNSYDYELSTGPNGMGLVQSGNITQNEVSVSSPLDESTSYYWRIRTNNNCGISDWSEDYIFTTIVCQTFGSTDIPADIPDDAAIAITSDLNIYDRGVVSDFDIVDLIGTHTWMNDLNFSMTSPDNTKMEFWDQPCGSQNNFDINFDDEALNSNYPCPPTDGGTYIPDNVLSVFDAKNILGLWQLEIYDDFNQDGGELQSWGLKICIEDYCDLTVSNTDASGLGSFLGAINCAEPGDTVRLMSDIANQSINLTNTITLNQDVNILADSTDNIILNFSISNAGLIIAPAVNVSFEGFTIQAIGTQPSLTNNGSIKITNMDIIQPLDNQLINSATGSIEIFGSCNIKE